MDDDVTRRGELHRRFGADCFNAAWDLIDRPDRSDDDDTEMLLAAAASRWHWRQGGTADEIAVGDWQVAHVACLLGDSDLALRFARRNLATAEREGWDGWRLGSAHEGMARAFAVAGDSTASARHVAAARDALAREPSADDRDVVEQQLATVPRP